MTGLQKLIAAVTGTITGATIAWAVKACCWFKTKDDSKSINNKIDGAFSEEDSLKNLKS